MYSLLTFHCAANDIKLTINYSKDRSCYDRIPDVAERYITAMRTISNHHHHPHHHPRLQLPQQIFLQQSKLQSHMLTTVRQTSNNSDSGCPTNDVYKFGREAENILRNHNYIGKQGGNVTRTRTTTAGSDVVQSGRPIFDDFFQHLWPYIGNKTANVVFQMVKRL
ncbi:hypothetical protein TNCV_3057641 [Trichonephila clavipes]|nr:hypothetical protein TNCV_3057641 [Trichonephila clavipes]